MSGYWFDFDELDNERASEDERDSKMPIGDSKMAIGSSESADVAVEAEGAVEADVAVEAAKDERKSQASVEASAAKKVEEVAKVAREIEEERKAREAAEAEAAEAAEAEKALSLDPSLVDAICWQKLGRLLGKIPDQKLSRPLPGAPLLPTAEDLLNGKAAYQARYPEPSSRVVDWSSAPALEAAYSERSQGIADGTRQQAPKSTPGSDGRSQYLVSVISPTTTSRRCFHSMLWECFRCQTHERRELIVVETGLSLPSAFWMALADEDPRVIYRHFAVDERSWNVGTKRNIACALAAGQVIAHFDDDDLYAPSYLEAMLGQMLSPSPADVERDPPDSTAIRLKLSPKETSLALGRFSAASAKLSAWFKFAVVTGMWGMCNPKLAASLRYSKSRHPEIDNTLYGWGFSMVYLRIAWLLFPFPEKQLGEDYDFLTNLMAAGLPVVLPRDMRGICAHTSHRTNTSGRSMERTEPVRSDVVTGSGMAPLLDNYRRVLEEYKRIHQAEFSTLPGMKGQAH